MLRVAAPLHSLGERLAQDTTSPCSGSSIVHTCVACFRKLASLECLLRRGGCTSFGEQHGQLMSRCLQAKRPICVWSHPFAAPFPCAGFVNSSIHLLFAVISQVLAVGVAASEGGDCTWRFTAITHLIWSVTRVISSSFACDRVSVELTYSLKLPMVASTSHR